MRKFERALFIWDDRCASNTQVAGKDVFASTFLGSERFIDWAKEKWIDHKNADVRNIPVLKELKGAPSLGDIEQRVGSVVNGKDAFYRKFCLYVS